MLSIVPLKNAAQALSYYTEDENYYTKDAKQECQWYGKGAAALGLNGCIEVDAFKALLEGKLPNGQQLGRMTQEGIEHRPGYDLTFSAPKSASIIAEVGGDKRLDTIEEKAVNFTLDHVEKYAAQTRTLKNGTIIFEKTGNLVIAKFPHNTSRVLEPQKHTHCVVMNATQLPNGQWRSLSSEEIFEQKMLAGMVYRSVFAYELQQLGYKIEKTHTDGRFEIVGVPKELIDHFSTRRKQIEEILSEKGLEGGKASWFAAIDNRQDKQVIDIDKLRSDWREETKAMGFDVEALVMACSKSEVTPLPNPKQDAKAAVYYAMNHLSEREAVFSQSQLLRHALAHSVGKALPHHVEHAVKQTYQKKLLIRRYDLEGHYWTTPQAMALEKDTISKMLEGRYSVARMMVSDIVQQQLSNNTFLNHSQKVAVHHILISPDRIIGIQGYAGVGKTTMLSVVKTMVEKEGFVLQGLAPSAAAAQQLQNGSGIQSKTLAKFLIENQQTGPDLGTVLAKDKHAAKKIFILDESSMVSTQRMNELLTIIHRIGARLVLVGDYQQLGAVEAGKPFYQLLKAGMQTIIMKTILRQKDNPILLEAVHASIAGDIKKVLQKIGDNIFEISNKDNRLRQMANDYLALSKEERADTLVLTSTNADRQVINSHIRMGLKQEGILTGQELTMSVLVKRDLTQAQKMNTENYTLNDVIRFNQAYTKLGIKKDDYLNVTGVDPEKKTVSLQNKEGKCISWQPHLIAGKREGTIEVYQNEERQLLVGDTIRWLRNDKSSGLYNSSQAKIVDIEKDFIQLRLNNGKLKKISMTGHHFKHWDHAYVLTVHAAQGQTCDRVLAQGESYRKELTHQQSFYVTISRSKFEVKLYVDDKKDFLNVLEKYTGEKSSALVMQINNNNTILEKNILEI